MHVLQRLGASRMSYKCVYFYTCIKIYSFYTSFIRVCLPKLGIRLYLYKHLYKYKLAYIEKKSHFFHATFEHSTSSYYPEARPHFFSYTFEHLAISNQCCFLLSWSTNSLFFIHVRALGNQPMLVQTRQRVKYPCLFVLLIHASNFNLEKWLHATAHIYCSILIM